jgi:hypothetical protein
LHDEYGSCRRCPEEWSLQGSTFGGILGITQ